VSYLVKQWVGQRGRQPFAAGETPAVRLARLWLGAVVAILTPDSAARSLAPSPERTQAYSVLRDAAAAVRVTVDDAEQERSEAWLDHLLAAVNLLGRDEGSVLAVSALAWAAVSAWQDLGGAPWTRCAASCARLACKLDKLVPGGADTLAPRLGDALRRAMDREADRLWLGYVRNPLRPEVVSAMLTVEGTVEGTA
jgi:hypothetical protein